jgi:hypothetical protein
MQLLKTGFLYFALVFAAGFVLGTVRVLWLVPRLGERTAELMETPIMLLVIIIAARWVLRRFPAPPALPKRLAVGVIGLALLLVAEITFVLSLRGLSIAKYVAMRDPVSGSVYLAMLVVFAVMPLLVARR